MNYYYSLDRAPVVFVHRPYFVCIRVMAKSSEVALYDAASFSYSGKRFEAHVAKKNGKDNSRRLEEVSREAERLMEGQGLQTEMELPVRRCGTARRGLRLQIEGVEPVTARMALVNESAVSTE